MSDSIFTLYNSSIKQNPNDLLTAIIGNINGINIVPNSVNYFGSELAVSTFSSFNFGGPVKMAKPGILLTSGDGTPALTNNSSSYSQDNDAKGDAELDTLANKAFDYAGSTQDASILAFSFTVADPMVKSVSFDIVFGSDEYPVFIDSNYVDIAAILVNGTNYGLFNGDPKKPLSIIGNSVNSGSFHDNTSSSYSIEYNGISPLMTVQVPLDGSSVYNVRLAIADTGDAIYDSGLFISNFSSSISGAGGLLVKVYADPKGGVVMPAGDDTATLFIGGKNNDVMNGSTAADVYDLLAGGNNVIQGSLLQLNNDTVLGFNSGDTLSFLDSFFTADNLTVTMGSAILAVDTNGDGKADSTITLEGDYQNAQFNVKQTAKGSEITMLGLGSITAQQEIELAELYVGFFGRAAENAGLEYWKGHLGTLLKSGLNEDQAFVEIANNFWEAAKEFSTTTGYTEHMSNFDFVAKVYSNVLGRPDAVTNDRDGVEYWTTLMNDSGVTKGQMVLAILEGAHYYIDENPKDTIAQYVDSLLDNRTDISLFFAQESISGNLTGQAAIELGMDVIRRIDQNKSTVNAVKTALLNDTLYDLPEIDLVGTGTAPAFHADALGM